MLRSGAMGKPCVLIVDRDPVTLMNLEAELGQDFEVLLASDLHEAYELLDERDADVCAFVSDLLVHSSKGLRQRPKLLWKRVPSAARIVVTAHENMEQQTITGVDTIVNAQDILAKPWEPGSVLASLHRALKSPRPAL